MTSKRDIFGNQLTQQQVAAGQRMWNRSAPGRPGRVVQSSHSAEDNAAKTWIMYADPHGDEIGVVECEIYVVGRASDGNEGVVMLHGMCPKCGETFIAREDNKALTIDYIHYRKAPKFLRIHWKWHSENVLNRRVADADSIPVVSSPERWMCDYCKEWCVRVHAGVAKDDFKGATIISTPRSDRSAAAVEPKTAILDF